MSLLEPCYIEPESGTRYPLTDRRWRSDDKKPLLISPLPGISPADIDTGKRSLWRYAAALPVDISDPVSLGEGCTPLIEKTYGSTNIHFKLEWFSPTGSFKDRGSSVMISYLRQVGISHILEDSSGNGGASVAAYGAVAGLGVRILTPSSTSPGKITQIRAYGAEVQLVPGPREASEQELMRQSDESDRYFCASHNWHPFFLQGTKSVGYELWEDLAFRAPDNIIIPTGAGSNVLGCDIAFNELKRAGQIDRLPRIFAVQPKNCSPIHASFQAAGGPLVPATFAPTIAEGTAIKSPVRLQEILACLHRSGGKTVAVEEDEIGAAILKLAAMGLYAEPTSCGVVPALDRLLATGDIKPGETTVVLLTGTGLKATAFMTEHIKANAAP